MKQFLKFGFIIFLTACLVLAGCTTTKTTEYEYPIELSFAYHAPSESSLAKAILVPFAEDLEEITEGRLKIVQYPGGSLLSSEDEYDGVLTGVCDIAQFNPEDYPGRFPLSGMHVLPYMYPNTEIAGLVSHEIYNKYSLTTDLKDVKLLITAPLYTSNYFGNEPVTKMEDFQGLSIRSVGEMWGEIITLLGGTPSEVGTGDLSSALDRGLVDGTFFTWSGALAFGIQNVTQYRTEVGMSQDVHLVVMNKDTFANLPADIQEILNDYCVPETSGEYAAAHMDMEGGGKGAIAGMDAKAGKPPITVLSDEELARWKATVEPVIAQWVAQQGAIGQEMLDYAKNEIAKYSQP